MSKKGSKKFKRPSRRETDVALKVNGNDLKVEEVPFFRYKVSECFSEIPLPGKDDWLANFSEKGQTFDMFKVMSRAMPQPDENRRSMYIHPIGMFSGVRSIPLSIIEEYMDCFFESLNTKFLPTLTMTEAGQIHPLVARKRSNNLYTQIQTYSLFDFLKKCRKISFGYENRSQDELISVALVHPYDLYPEDSWNFVFGQADQENGIGCYSLARFDPLFPNIELSLFSQTMSKFSEDEYLLFLKRSLDTLTHEICHLFGLDHCIYFSCLMNGSNHLEESDRSPVFLCPVCLRKLHHYLKFDIRKRYEKLMGFFEKHKIVEEAQWVKKRLAEVPISTGVSIRRNRGKKRKKKKKGSGNN